MEGIMLSKAAAAVFRARDRVNAGLVFSDGSPSAVLAAIKRAEVDLLRAVRALADGASPDGLSGRDLERYDALVEGCAKVSAARERLEMEMTQDAAIDAMRAVDSAVDACLMV